MAEPAIKPMTLDEFLHWDDGTETHYELIGGFPVGMAPPAAAHRMLAMRLGSRIDFALEKRRPCNAQGDAGVIQPERADTYFEADIAATCERHEFGQQALRQPFLIVEILSPSTERHDRRVKLPAYRQIETVQEIALIASDEIYAEVHRRAGPQWITEILRGGQSVLSLTSIPIEIRLSDLYEGIAFADAESGSPGEA
ncbi:MAG TPA: Uma2 family endonuclease [Stellaceae bacterium]|nr:Uma2 family endonuclease [Stellaceae bacterium]